MGTTSGSGIGDSGNAFTILNESTVRLQSGTEIDVSTPEGVAAAQASLTDEQFMQLKSLGFGSADGFILRTKADVLRAAEQGGPTSVSAGKTELDAEVIGIFKAAGMPDPYNANTTEKSLQQIKANPVTSAAFQTTVETLKTYLADPNASNQKAATEALGFSNPSFGGLNWAEVVFLALRESILDTNEDKRYALHLLQDENKKADLVSKHLSTLIECQQKLSNSLATEEKYTKADDYAGESMKATVEVPLWENVDLTTLDKTGNLVGDKTTKMLERSGLEAEIKRVEAMQETLRNRRQMVTNMFQNFDQQSNRNFNLLASVLKTRNEMMSGTNKNIM